MDHQSLSCSPCINVIKNKVDLILLRNMLFLDNMDRNRYIEVEHNWYHGIILLTVSSCGKVVVRSTGQGMS